MMDDIINEEDRLELHQWLQDLADSLDDSVTYATASLVYRKELVERVERMGARS